MKKNVKQIRPLEDNFSDWYSDLILKGDLVSYGPVTGTMILKPHGYALWSNIVNHLNQRFKDNNITDVYMPLLIPMSLLNQEKAHIEGFAPECAIVTKVGDKELNEPLVIRPTSEVLFGRYFAENINSYKELPLLYNQWVNVIRWEKNPRPFLRSNEFLWQEGHSVHSSAHEAQQWTLKMMSLYVTFFKEVLAVAVLSGKKSNHEKFAGAVSTYSLEALMLDGQALQSATSHYFGQNFAIPFKIDFTNADNILEFAYQTSWGLSTRVIGALVMNHGDNYGLVLPPKIAPIQIAIIPIQNDNTVIATSDEVYELLKASYRTIIDKTDKTPGYKFSHYEIKGVPLRIEIGKKELENKEVLVVQRNNGVKTKVKIVHLPVTLQSMLDKMQSDLYEQSLKNLQSRCYDVKTFDEYVKHLKKQTGFFGAWFCNRIECEAEIKQLTATVSRCQDLEKAPKDVNKCFKCLTEAKGYFYFARAY